MTWRDKFREGSFRGVPFKTEKHELEGGRRKQDREYAKRDLGDSEDLGRKLKKFRLELFVLDVDYFAARDALQDALDAEGPGILVHPYKGTIRVQAGAYTLVETVKEGNKAKFTVEFSEKGPANQFPAIVEDDILNAIENADTLIDESTSFFEEVLDTINQAAFVLEAASADLNAVADAIETAITSVTEPVARLTFAISNFKADIDSLLKLPGELADRLKEIFSELLDEFENDPETTERIMGNFVEGIDDNFEPVIGETPSRNTQRQNQAAIRNISVEISLSTQTKAAVEIDFISTARALLSRNTIIAGLDEQAEATPSDELYQAIKEVETSLTKAVPRIGTTELTTFTPKKTLPAIVIAHKLFDDIEKEDEIVDQNNIEHPGFVPGGDEIEVSVG